MRCSWCESMLDAYLEHELHPKAAARVRHHLRACASCRELLAELRVVDGLLATPRIAELPPNFSFAAMAEVRNTVPPHRRHSPVWIGLAMYVVCAWIAGTVAALAFRGGRWSDALRGTLAAASGNGAWHAVAGTLHGFSTFSPVVIPTVAVILAIDVALLAAVFFFYRAVRPWLATRLADGESP